MKSQQELLQKVQEIVSQCDRCGTCLTVCPLYGAKDVESSSARGKNNLALGLLQGVIKPTKQVQEAMDFCLLCRTCVDNCPTKVQTDEAMMALRQYMAHTTGSVSLEYKVLGSLMKNRLMVKLSSGALGVMRKIGVNKLIPYGVVPCEFTRDEYTAAFAGPAALGTPEDRPSASVSADTKVAYFRGCGMEMMFPDAAMRTREILATLTTPQFVDNSCCGLLHIAHGMQEDFYKMAKENIRLFENADVIVTDCASCSSTLKHFGKYFADDSEWKDRADAFSKKIMDLTEYLVKAGYKPKQKTNATLTFHEPCHLGRGQGVRKQPRELLKAAGNYVEMKGADVCCGGAGSFHIDYPEISGSLLDKKRVNIENTKADIVVTECPTCLVQMKKAAELSGGKFKVMHISQVL
jgi:glycolate oxidase iron-sulfur subunit